MATFTLFRGVNNFYRSDEAVEYPEELQPHNPRGDLRIESVYTDITWQEILKRLEILYKKQPEDLAVGDILEIIATPSFSQLRSVAVESVEEEAGFTFNIEWNNGIDAAATVSGNQITTTCTDTNTSTVAAGDSTGFGAVAANTTEQRVIVVPADGLTALTGHVHGTVQLVVTAVPDPWLMSGKYRFRVNHENHEVIRCGGC